MKLLRLYKLNGTEMQRLFVKARRLSDKHLREICGLLVYDGAIIDLVETRNLRRQPLRSWISPKDWKTIEREAEKRGHRIVGTFHSHVISRAIPGPGDIAGAVDGHLMLIFDTCVKSRSHEAALWAIRRGKASRVKCRRHWPAA